MGPGSLRLWIVLLLGGTLIVRLVRRTRGGPSSRPLDRSLVGKTGDVTATIERGGAGGRIRIEGRELAAISAERIEAGGFGEIVGIDGQTVKVVQVPALSSHTTGYHMMEM